MFFNISEVQFVLTICNIWTIAIKKNLIHVTKVIHIVFYSIHNYFLCLVKLKIEKYNKLNRFWFWISIPDNITLKTNLWIIRVLDMPC